MVNVALSELGGVPLEVLGGGDRGVPVSTDAFPRIWLPNRRDFVKADDVALKADAFRSVGTIMVGEMDS